MVVFETGKTHKVVKITKPDGDKVYAVRHKDHDDVNEYETIALFDAIKVAKLYESYLVQATEFEADDGLWGRAKAQLNIPGLN